MLGLVLVVGLAVWYLRQQVEVSPVESIDWAENHIVDQEGRQILTIENFPDDIQVSPENSFGSSDAITKAVLSPDDNWIAIGVAGAAHEFGWMYNVLLDNVVPVAFQFGGGVEPIIWRADSKYIVFSITSPGDFTRLKLVNVLEMTEYPETTGFIIQAPIENELPPEEISYEVIEWRNNELCFRANEFRYCIDPDSRSIEEI